MNVGLALSGGGIKAFSQLPIIDAIFQEGIKIDAVSGTSMGSIIAIFLACGLDIGEVTEVILELETELNKMKVFSRPSPKVLPFSKERIHGGYVDPMRLESILEKTLERYQVNHISDVKIPLAIPAVDIISGKIVVFVSHPNLFKKKSKHWEIISDVSLAKAAVSSCAFPFVISANKLDDYMLVDGGVRMNLPLPLLDGYGVTQRVGVTMHRESPFREFHSLTSLGNRVVDLMAIEQEEKFIRKDDIVINVSLEKVWVFEMGMGRYTIEKGEIVAKEKIKDLQRIEKNPSFIKRMRRKMFKTY